MEGKGSEVIDMNGYDSRLLSIASLNQLRLPVARQTTKAPAKEEKRRSANSPSEFRAVRYSAQSDSRPA